MRYTDFSRIADEEAIYASQADGVDYFLRTAPAEGGLRASITIQVMNPKSGESLRIFSTPKELVDVPVLVGMTPEDARSLLQEALATARANRQSELSLEDWLGLSGNGKAR